MRRAIFICVWLVAAAVAGPAITFPPAPQSGRVVDRILARIEGDIILQSQVRELGAFQQLIEDHAESDDQLPSELIEQWVVQTEAASSHFPAPAESEVDRELSRVTARFANPAAYSARLHELVLSPAQVRAVFSRQIYFERILAYKFRPAVDVESADIDAYY